MEQNLIKEINSKEELESIINETIDKYVIVDFMAEWCGPCKILRPTLNSIAAEHDNVEVVSINVDNNEELAQEYNVKGIPCVYIYKNKEELTRFTGNKSKIDIEKMLE